MLSILRGLICLARLVHLPKLRRFGTSSQPFIWHQARKQRAASKTPIWLIRSEWHLPFRHAPGERRRRAGTGYWGLPAHPISASNETHAGSP
jgi:hypothetical protein